MKRESVLIAPIVTEKTVQDAGVYTFKVHNDATKTDVKNAVNTFYNVKVKSVNVINVPEKMKMARRGQATMKRKPYRKALVRLQDGETLEFNQFA